MRRGTALESSGKQHGACDGRHPNCAASTTTQVPHDENGARPPALRFHSAAAVRRRVCRARNGVISVTAAARIPCSVRFARHRRVAARLRDPDHRQRAAEHADLAAADPAASTVDRRRDRAVRVLRRLHGGCVMGRRADRPGRPSSCVRYVRCRRRVLRARLRGLGQRACVGRAALRHGLLPRRHLHGGRELAAPGREQRASRARVLRVPDHELPRRRHRPVSDRARRPCRLRAVQRGERAVFGIADSGRAGRRHARRAEPSHARLEARARHLRIARGRCVGAARADRLRGGGHAERRVLHDAARVHATSRLSGRSGVALHGLRAAGGARAAMAGRATRGPLRPAPHRARDHRRLCRVQRVAVHAAQRSAARSVRLCVRRARVFAVRRADVVCERQHSRRSTRRGQRRPAADFLAGRERRGAPPGRQAAPRGFICSRRS
jgi:hypothetical protein